MGNMMQKKDEYISSADNELRKEQTDRWKY